MKTRDIRRDEYGRGRGILFRGALVILLLGVATTVQAQSGPPFGLFITSTGGGSVTEPGEGAFHYDEVTQDVDVTATPDAHHHFVRWAGTAADDGKVADLLAASTTVTVEEHDRGLHACFDIDHHTLEISSTAGGTVDTPGEGSFCYDYGTVVTVDANVADHYHFTGWTGTAVDAGMVGDPNATSTTVTVEGDYTLSATFAIDQHTLDVSSTCGGTVDDPGIGCFTYDYGTVVTIDANAADHYHFTGWTGSAVADCNVVDPNAPTTTLTVKGDCSLKATFAIDQHTLTVSSGSNGTVDNPGIGTFTYDYGTVVCVDANAADHYHFTNWTGSAVTDCNLVDPNAASTSLTVKADCTLTASFAIDQHTLTVSATTGGTVDNPGLGAFVYDYGTVVPVDANVADHYHFIGWAGTAVADANVADPNALSTTVTIADDYTLQAVFAIDQNAVTITATAGGTVRKPGLGTYNFDWDSSAELEAVAGPLFAFSHWSGTYSDDRAKAAVRIRQDHEIRAHFVSLLDTIYVACSEPGDPAEDGTAEHPFNSIQEAIEVAAEGAQILVDGGVYHEQIDLLDKNISVMGLWLSDPNVVEEPIIDGGGTGPLVTFRGAEDANCVVAGLRLQGAEAPYATAIYCLGSPVIANCVIVGNHTAGLNGAAIYCENSSAAFVNCTIVENLSDMEGALLTSVDSNVTLSNSILWNNVPSTVETISGDAPLMDYCDVEGGWPGTDNLDVAPAFVMPSPWVEVGIVGWSGDDVWSVGDYHLLSEAGYWDVTTGAYVLGDTTSSCIDAGDPAQDFGWEPVPNGARVNLGAYGGTNQASLSSK